MSGVTVGPHREIKTGNLVSDGISAANKPSSISHPNVQQVLADKESIQDFVAELFTGTQHENATFSYNDETNELTLTVQLDGVNLNTLVSRVSNLEENTDGLVSGADPLSYYILAKGT